MDNLKQYLLTVICASAVCAIIVAISEKNGTQTSVIKLLCAIYISITAVSPWLEIKLHDLTSYFGTIHTEAASIVDTNILLSEDKTKTLIKERIQEYIYDKAATLGAEVHVDVVLSDTKPYPPETIKLTGSMTPYNKQRLQKIISEELGIPEVNQKWN